MTEAAMIFTTGDGERFPNSRSTREALARWAKSEFTSRKELARALDLTLDQARSVMDGEASAVTVDHIWRHPRGGPRVAFAVIRAVTGSAFDQFIATELEEIARAERRMEENDRNARSLWARALAGGAPPRGRAGLGDPEAGLRDRADRRAD